MDEGYSVIREFWVTVRLIVVVWCSILCCCCLSHSRYEGITLLPLLSLIIFFYFERVHDLLNRLAYMFIAKYKLHEIIRKNIHIKSWIAAHKITSTRLYLNWLKHMCGPSTHGISLVRHRTWYKTCIRYKKRIKTGIPHRSYFENLPDIYIYIYIYVTYLIRNESMLNRSTYVNINVYISKSLNE